MSDYSPGSDRYFLEEFSEAPGDTPYDWEADDDEDEVS